MNTKEKITMAMNARYHMLEKEGNDTPIPWYKKDMEAQCVEVLHWLVRLKDGDFDEF